MQFPWESCPRPPEGPSRRITSHKMKTLGHCRRFTKCAHVPFHGISSLMNMKNIRLWGSLLPRTFTTVYAQPAHDMATECAEKGHARRAKVRLG